MGKPIRVALCDDHTMVRSGLHRILAEEPGIEVAGEAGTAAEAIELAARTRPDVLVMDRGRGGDAAGAGEAEVHGKNAWPGPCG